MKKNLHKHSRNSCHFAQLFEYHITLSQSIKFSNENHGQLTVFLALPMFFS